MTTRRIECSVSYVLYLVKEEGLEVGTAHAEDSMGVHPSAFH